MRQGCPIIRAFATASEADPLTRSRTEPDSPSLTRRLLWPVYAPSTLLGVAAGATVPVQVVAAMHLGASGSLAALAVAGAGAVGLVSTVSAGRLIDRTGDTCAMVLATVVACLTEVAAIIALAAEGPASLAVFIGAALVRAPALNIWGLARQAYTAEHVEPSEVGRAMTGLGGTMRIGALVGPLLGGLMLLVAPLWAVYVLSMVCAIAAVGIMLAPSKALVGGGVRRGFRETAATSADTVGSRVAAGRLDVVWRRVLLAGVAICALSVARAGQPVLVQLWGVHIGLTPSRISLLIAVGAAIEVACMVPGGRLKDRLGRSLILIVCLAVYGAGFLLMVPLTALAGIPGLVGAVVVMSIGNGLGAGVNMTIGADLSPAVGRGRFLGIWALFNNVGALGGPLLISVLVAVATESAAILAVGAIAALGAVWVMTFARGMALPRGVTRHR